MIPRLCAGVCVCVLSVWENPSALLLAFPRLYLFLFYGIFLLPAALIKPESDSPSRSAVVSDSGVGSADHGNDEKLIFWCEHSTLYYINAGAQLVFSTLLISHSFHSTHVRRHTCVRTCLECSFIELVSVWPHRCVCVLDSVPNIVSDCASSGYPSFFFLVKFGC